MKPNRLEVGTTWGTIVFHTMGGKVIDCTLPLLTAEPDIPFAVENHVGDRVSAFVASVLDGRKRKIPTIGDLDGTPFQIEVWKAIAAIPRGETKTYGELARTIGKPKAFRAVANACGANPVPLFIPCHRVVGANGSIGGFSSGLVWKRLLLLAER